MSASERDDDNWRPDRFDYIEARLKRLEQQAGLEPLDLKQFLATWKREEK